MTKNVLPKMQLPFFANKALQTAAQYHFNIDTETRSPQGDVHFDRR